MSTVVRFLIFCLVLTCTATLATAAPLYKVELVQVVHRHGARSALVTGNETLICGTEFPCGILNYQGQTMLENFGKFLHYRYREDPEVVAEPYFPYESYNLSIAYTRSTDVLRTLQSAGALLRGLYPNISAFFPAIHTVETAEDVLLHSSLVPIILARYNYGDQEVRDLCDPVLDQRMTFEKLQAVAAEVHSQYFCANFTLRSQCAEQLCDIAHAYESTGQIDSFPLLRQHLDDVCAITATSSRYYFGYNASDPVHRKQGAPYYHLTKLLMENMKAHQRPSTAPSFKLYQYSAHDTTIAPLAASFGDSSLEAMLPPFGTAFIIDLLTRVDAPASSTSSRYYVRLLRGHSGVTPSTNFTFALGSFSMRCMNEAGHVYVAPDNICPFADLERFVNSTAPSSPMGTCYLDPGLYDRMGCPVDAMSDSRNLSEDCHFYRKYCGKFACGEGYHLAAADYGCYPTFVMKQSSSSSSLSKGGIAALCLVLFIAGGAAGGAGWEGWRRYQKSKSEQNEALVENF